MSENRKIMKKIMAIILVILCVSTNTMNIWASDDAYQETINRLSQTEIIAEEAANQEPEIAEEELETDVTILQEGTISIVASNNKARETTQVGEFTWHTDYQYVDGKLRYGFIIDSIVGEIPANMTVVLQLSSCTKLGEVATTYALMPMTFLASEIKAGATKYGYATPKTMFWVLNGAYTATMVSGYTNTGVIPVKGAYLTNKKGQLFPQYIDPVSKKDTASQIETNWEKISPVPAWTGRKKYIQDFEAIYGEQDVENYWKKVQIHHIRPRAYGGSDDFSNLVPVETTAHTLITTWFRNY